MGVCPSETYEAYQLSKIPRRPKVSANRESQNSTTSETELQKYLNECFDRYDKNGNGFL